MIVEALRLPGPFVPGWFPLVVERVDPLLGPTRGEATIDLLGSQMSLDTRESMQRRFFYHCYEAPEVSFVRRWLRPGDRAVDVGAHVGVFTLLAARLVGQTGHVYAFEPVPANFDRLSGNVEQNRYTWVTAERAAVSDTTSEVTLGLHETRSVGNSTADFSIGGTLSTVTAPTIVLDDYLQDKRIRLMKIDAEGAEPEVLRGAKDLLRLNPPDAILIEINYKLLRRHNSAPAEVIGQLTDAGYSMHSLGRRRALKTFPPLARIEEAARKWESKPESRSSLIVGWTTRYIMFNAVAIRGPRG